MACKGEGDYCIYRSGVVLGALPLFVMTMAEWCRMAAEWANSNAAGQWNILGFSCLQGDLNSGCVWGGTLGPSLSINTREMGYRATLFSPF